MRYSASQIEKWRRCPRKWAFEYDFGHKPKQTARQAQGSAIHKEAEDAVSEGTEPERPETWALLGLVRLDVEHLVEAYMSIPLGDDDEVIGYIDLVELAWPPRVVDHKTTSNPRYAKTAPELLTDTQMTLYGWWVIANVGCDQVEIAHHYVTTKGRMRAWAERAVLTADMADDAMARHLHVIDQMKYVRGRVRAKDYEPRGRTNGECHRYGGCPHLSRCEAANMGIEPERLRKS